MSPSNPSRGLSRACRGAHARGHTFYETAVVLSRAPDIIEHGQQWSLVPAGVKTAVEAILAPSFTDGSSRTRSGGERDPTDCPPPVGPSLASGPPESTRGSAHKARPYRLSSACRAGPRVRAAADAVRRPASAKAPARHADPRPASDCIVSAAWARFQSRTPQHRRYFWSVDRLRIELTVSGETSEVCLAFELGRGLEYSALTRN